ncbi:MAG: sigma-70 family RNA polymerase sigma factor [Micavibrio sp.]|nr:sigma-70 family RNA polymerase sigma factor [Micavibrio sp.]
MFDQKALVAEMANLQRFALRLTRNSSDAEDLVQATLLRALEKKEYFMDGTNLFSWSSKIMFNIFASQYRRKKKFETQYDPTPYIEQASVAPHQEAVTDLAKVRDAMKTLSAEHREMLVLVCIRGLRYEEVSEKLQIPVGTVRSRLSRARKQLQDVLENPVPLQVGSDETMGIPAHMITAGAAQDFHGHA